MPADGASKGAASGKPAPQRRPTRLRLIGERSEDELQKSVADMLDFAFAGHPVVWTHFPAGGYELTKAARARLLRLGLKPGFPDIFVFWKPRKVLMIELKTMKGVTSGHQRAMHAALFGIEIPVEVCRSEEEVIACLKKHGVPMKEMSFGKTTAHTSRSATEIPRREAGQEEAVAGPSAASV